MNDLRNKLSNKKLIKYLDQNYSQNLIYKQNKIDEILIENIDIEIKNYFENQQGTINVLDSLEKEFNKDSLLKYLKLTNLRNFINSFKNETSNYNLIETDHLRIYRNIIQKVKEIAKNKNADIYFVYMPVQTGIM